MMGETVCCGVAARGGGCDRPNSVSQQCGLYHRFGHKGASSRGEGLAKTWGYTGL
jgi:hypothetical protein